MNNIINEILEKQLDIIDEKKKLTYKDILKILTKIDSESFINDDNKCVLWCKTSNTIKIDNDKKRRNIVQRILYQNFVNNDLERSEFIKYKCNNRQTCCNINHLYKTRKSDRVIYLQTRLNKRKTHILKKSSINDLFISLD
jgi:hypothetical protein